MLDGSDAIADWPLLNAMVNVASRRVLGVDPPRRRRRHRPLDPRRPGQRRRRHRARRAEARARADQRPGAWASSATSTRATSARRRSRRRAACASRCGRALDALLRGLRLARRRPGRRRRADRGRGRRGSPPSRPAQTRDGATIAARRDAARASPTRTRTRSTARCAGARTAAAARSGPGARTCTRSPERLDPDTLLRARPRGTYARDGAGRDHVRRRVPLPAPRRRRRPYADPNAMGEALIAAAAEAGIRITLLDACYLAGGFGEPPERRAAALHRRRRATPGPSASSALRGAPHARIGAAIHSVRAVPADQLATVVEWARERGAPLHVHLSEQRAENEACLAAHGRTPGAAARRARRARRRTRPPSTPPTSPTTTSRCSASTDDLHVPDDRARPRRRHRPGARARGSPLCLGSDSHAVIDLFEEARAVELDERLRDRAPRPLHGADAAARARPTTPRLGWPDAGRIEPGALADLVTVALDSVRLAGAEPETLLESRVRGDAATCARSVVGRAAIVRDGRHATLDVAAELRRCRVTC